MQKLNFLFIIFIAVCLSSCQIFQPSVMLRTKKGFKYSAQTDSVLTEYKITANDRLQFRLFSNDGFKLIDIANSAQGNQNVITTSLQYLVEFDGTVKFPILGRVPVSNMTLREAELMLEEKFANYYNKPFVMLSITNQRVTMFPGSEGTAKVISLTNQNTTLFEALAQAGGISSNGKARKIKLIRGDLQNPQIFLIDLSTIEGMKEADLVLQANDIIYVEPTFSVTRELLAELTPIVSLISSIVSVIAIIQLSK